MKNQRNKFEDGCLRRLSEVVPAGCRVTILADRGFGDQKLFAFLGELGFGYVIRFRGNIQVADADGLIRPAAEWVGKGGRARKLRDARVTAKGQLVGAVVCVHAKGMKEPWCLATSLRDATAATLVNYYAKRWTIEPQFRDTKDLQFGMGLSATRIGEPMRRDRLLLISAPRLRMGMLRHHAADAAGHGRRKSRHGPLAQVQYQRETDALLVSPRLHALRPDPEHATTPALTAYPQVGLPFEGQQLRHTGESYVRF